MASGSGDIEAVMSLITAGADINHQNQVEIHMYIIYTVYCTCVIIDYYFSYTMYIHVYMYTVCYLMKYTRLFLLYYNTHVLSQHMK